MEEKYNEEEIYDKLLELKEGTEKERKLAFKCSGILGNESTTETFENRLKIVSKLINDYYKK